MRLLLALPAFLLFVASAQAAELSSTVSLTSDYRFHGISQSAGDPAIQASFDVAYDNGAYLGIWASNVDFGDDANTEIDYYAGYYSEVSDQFSWDLTFYYYTYPGYDTDIDYAELDLNLGIGDVNVEIAYANDYANTGESAQYIAVDYSVDLNESVALDLHLGYSLGDYWDKLDVGEYMDISIGVSTTYSGFDISAAYLTNDIDDGMEVGSGPFANDDTLVLTVSKTFDF